MHVRSFHPSDLPVLRDITASAFDGVSIDQSIEREFGIIHGHHWKWRKGRHLDVDVLREPDGIFVAEEQGRIVGCITTWMDKEAGIGHIPNIALVPECRGRGFGRRLIELALNRFRENGLSHARIETLVQNEVGKHLYQSMGFRDVARQVHFALNLNATEQTVELGDGLERPDAGEQPCHRPTADSYNDED